MSGSYNYNHNPRDIFSSLTSFSLCPELEREQEEDESRCRHKVARNPDYCLLHLSSITEPAQLEYGRAVIRQAEEQLHYSDGLHRE